MDDQKKDISYEIRPCLQGLKFSPTLMINEKVVGKRQKGEQVYHMGFGESPFPVHPVIQKSIASFADRNSYLPAVGLAELRKKAKDYFTRKLNLGNYSRHAMIGPGSKELIFDIQLAIEGDLLFPVPSWVSYIPQTYITRDRVVKIPTGLPGHYKLKAATLDAVIESVKEEGDNPSKLILNYPNNPTGITYTAQELREIAEVCRIHNIVVISDEIYGLVDFEGNHTSIANFYPEGTIVTTGLSKHLSLGGFRLGLALIPENMERLFVLMRSIASETFSSVSSPIQYGVIEAVAENSEIEKYVRDCTKIHSLISRYVRDSINALGINYPETSGAFYLYPDFGKFRDSLQKKYRIKTSEDLANKLLEIKSVAALPGTAFGDAEKNLRLRISTVDFVGKNVLDYYYAHPNAGAQELVEAVCPNIKEGVLRLLSFFKELD